MERWVGSVAIDQVRPPARCSAPARQPPSHPDMARALAGQAKNIAMGYSFTSTTVKPGIGCACGHSGLQARASAKQRPRAGSRTALLGTR